MPFSGGDGATYMDVRIKAVPPTTIYQRAFFSFDTSSLTGLTTAKFGFTVFDKAGTANFIIRVGNDLLGTNPNNPSYELNWSAHNGETTLYDGGIPDGVNEYDILNDINTSGNTDFRIAIAGDVEGNTVLSIYTTENGTNIPYIYWESGASQTSPTTEVTPTTQNTPTSYDAPTGTMTFGDSGYVYPTDDWGIRFTQLPGEEPPTTEGGGI